MNILSFSHSCIIDVNQQIYSDLAQLKNVNVQLISPNYWKSDSSGKKIKPTKLLNLNFILYNMPIIFAGNNTLFFYLFLPFKRLWNFKPDIIFLDEEPWSLVAFQAIVLSILLRCKLAFYTKQNLNKHYPFPFNVINGLSLKKAEKAFAISKDVENVLREKGFIKDTIQLPHGYDPALFFPDKEKRVGKRTELSINDEIIIGFIGRFIELKGIQILIRAAALLKDESELTKWKILLVGDGVYRRHLESLVAEFNLNYEVIFVGAVPHNIVCDYIRSMDILVLPSLTMPGGKEQFGRVIIEAMACGVPVVGSDSGEIPNLIRATGGGLITREGDVHELYLALKRLILNPTELQHLAQQGMTTVQTEYTNKAVAEKLNSILQAL